MKLKDQVCSLELAKKLKKLGVEQESLFNWVNEKLTFEQPSKEFKVASTSWYSAFTVAELGELLPKGWHSTKPWNDYEQESKGKWVCILWGESGETKEAFYAKNEANARAKMLIYLSEKNLIK